MLAGDYSIEYANMNNILPYKPQAQTNNHSFV